MPDRRFILDDQYGCLVRVHCPMRAVSCSAISGCGVSGRVKVNCAPPPGGLAGEISPPAASTIAFADRQSQAHDGTVALRRYRGRTDRVRATNTNSSKPKRKETEDLHG